MTRGRLGLLVAFLIMLIAACGDGAQGPGAIVRPSPGVSPLATEGAGPTGSPVPAAFGLFYREFGQEADVLWLANPTDPDKQRQLAQIPHHVGFGIWPALSPDGRYLAYNMFPQNRVRDSTDSQTWLLDLTSGQQQLLADKIDLRSFPLWSPDGKLLTVKRNAEDGIKLVQIDVFGRPPKEDVLLTGTVDQVLGLLPIGYAAAGHTFYFAQIRLSPPGTTIGAVDLDSGRLTSLFQASDQIIADVAFASSTNKVAFVVRQVGGERVVSRVQVADIATRTVSALSAPALGESSHFRPVWEPQGQKVAVAHLPEGGQPAGIVVLSLNGAESRSLPAPARGFDVPLAWSPDGRFLVVRSSEGISLENPGPSRMVAIEVSTGRRLEMSAGALADVIVVGWLKS